MTTLAELFDSLKYRVEEDEDGVRRYLNQAGQRHRVDGPAVIWPDGSLFWYQNGVLHREDGPAVTYTNGDKSWWLNGYRHRIGGPAVVWHGSVEWWLYGVQYTEEAYYHQLKTLEHTV